MCMVKIYTCYFQYYLYSNKYINIIISELYTSVIGSNHKKEIIYLNTNKNTCNHNNTLEIIKLNSQIINIHKNI